MSKKGSQPWCIFEPKSGDLLCTRCRERTPMPVNVRLGFLDDVLKAFLKAHRRCSK